LPKRAFVFLGVAACFVFLTSTSIAQNCCTSCHDSLSMKVCTDKESYAPGEKIRMWFQAKNTSNDTIYLETAMQPPGFFRLYKGYEEIYRLGGAKSQILGEITLFPDSSTQCPECPPPYSCTCYEFSFEWEIPKDLDGLYILIGHLVGFEASMTFNVSDATEIPEEEGIRAGQFELHQNYPNPFNSQTVIQYNLLINCKTKLEVYGILGRKIRTLLDEYQPRGYKKITWDGKDDHGRSVASGVYFYRVQTGELEQTKRMVLIR
jgi:hypothetical protein